MNLFLKGGVFMWPLLLLLISACVVGVRSLSKAQQKNGFQVNILALGFLSAVLGFLGHVSGIYLGMASASRAVDISLAVMAYGIGISLLPLIFGLFILIISIIFWMIIRRKSGLNAR